MDVISIAGRTFALYRRSFGVFYCVAVTAVLATPLFPLLKSLVWYVASVWIRAPGGSGVRTAQAVTKALSWVAHGVVSLLGLAAVVFVAAEMDKRRSVAAREVVTRVLRSSPVYWWTVKFLLSVGLLLALYCVPSCIAGLAIARWIGESPVAAWQNLMLACLVFGVMLSAPTAAWVVATRLPALPAVVLQGRSPGKAREVTRKRMKGARVQTFVIFAVLIAGPTAMPLLGFSIGSFVHAFQVGLSLGTQQVYLQTLQPKPFWLLYGETATWFFYSVLVFPVQGIALYFLHQDLRRRG